MTALTLSQCQAIVAEALLNKYPKLSRELLNEITSRSWTVASSTSYEMELLALLKPIEQFSDDVINQVVVLQLIERFWGMEASMKQPLQRIHNALFGRIKQNHFREENIVHDFGGVIKTPFLEIKARLDELERLCTVSIVSFASAPPTLKAFLLAYIFSAIIRIHPFADGNGRTARMIVLYALRFWRLPPILIPKVRNDATWKQSLSKALAGNMSDFQAQFLQRMKVGDSGTNLPTPTK